jgi:lipopolysaccharide transport system permease protein
LQQVLAETLPDRILVSRRFPGEKTMIEVPPVILKQRRSVGVGDVGVDQTPATVIEPSHGWAPLQLGDLWHYRELLYFLGWRDIKIRYRQTLIGGVWAVIQPLMTMVVFSVFFGHVAQMPSDGLPYPVFAFAALVPWTFFVRALSLASDSLVANSHLITKVYFPRLLIPLARVLGAVPDLIISFILLVGMVWWYGHVPNATSILWIPVLVLLASGMALGIGLWLSALNVWYRDIQHVVPFVTQLWLFATPIAYPSSLLSEPWRTLYALNPMVGVVEGFRWTLLGTGKSPGVMVALSALVALVTLASGAFFFRRVERTFADVV